MPSVLSWVELRVDVIFLKLYMEEGFAMCIYLYVAPPTVGAWSVAVVLWLLHEYNE